MNEALVKGLWIGWVPVVAALFRLIGPARAVLVSVIGGVLFLPSDDLPLAPPFIPLVFDKWVATGLGLVLGVLLFDRRSLARFRPQWLDLPMVVYALAPLIGLTVGGRPAAGDVVEVLGMRGIGWFVPYLMGRIYFGGSDGPGRVGIAIVLGGLAYIPFCLYEEVAGPSRYLAVLLYGTPFKEGMVERLGGWRPEVFLDNGIAVASWMSLTAVMATWLWLGQAWNVRGCPSWVPPLALLATTASCRGVYGYVNMAVGLTVALLTRFLRTRAVLGLLMAAPLVYMSVRASGVWDGGWLARGAGMTGRESTVGARLWTERVLSNAVLGRSPILGFGTIVYHTDVPFKPDALWLQTLWMGGIAGLMAHMAAVFLVPATLGLMTPPGRPSARQAASPRWALACWCLLQMLEGMHNSNNFTATALVGGTLVGSFLSRRTAPTDPEPASTAGPRDARRPPSPIPLMATLILLALIEILGLQREAGPPPPRSAPAGTGEHRP